METLHEAYQMAKKNDGAPGIDGVTFAAIEESGVDDFLQQILDELVTHTYRPMRARKKEIPKDGGKEVRVLSIPAIRDRVVQGALKLILEPIFEADFQPGSYGYRPKRTAQAAVNRVAQAIVEEKTRIIDIDLRAYFDNVQHYLLLEKVAQRVQDDEVMHLLKMILKANGEKGVPQGGVISPVLSNLYLTEVDRMLEKAMATTRHGKYTYVQYARFADDRVPRAQGPKGPAVRNCFIDEGRPLGIGLQEQVPNHLWRLRSKAVVVSAEGKGLGRTRSGDWQEED
jgi:RNA-directed DNA polymerase